jgi:hypothetical protein
MTDKPRLRHRTIARLIETKAPVTGREQDAEHLRNAATEIERLRVGSPRNALLNQQFSFCAPGPNQHVIGSDA